MLTIKRKCVALAFGVAVSGAASSGAIAQAIELRFASPAPPQSRVNTHGLAEWIKDVEAASGGTVTFRLMTGPSLATFENAYDRTVKGVADIAFGTSSSVGGQFPRTEVNTLPFETENPREAALALWRTYERGLFADEYSQIKPLALFSFPNNIIHTRSKPVKRLSDVKGMKLITAGKVGSDIIVALGAAPLSLTPAEYYQSIASGLAEGTMTAWTAMSAFKVYEVAKLHFNAPLAGGAPAYVVMNKRSFDRLPAQAKAAIDKLSGEAFSRRMGNVVQAQDDAAKEQIRGMSGQVFENITPDEQARWKKELDHISADWVKSVPNGQAILSGFREEVKRARSEK
jgi:TRAP-type C4-dicarboxylate transport system substrate-binding protein